MRFIYIYLFLMTASVACVTQANRSNLKKSINSGSDLIKASIAHHDPNNMWSEADLSIDFNSIVFRKDGTEEKSYRSIQLDNRQGVFEVYSLRDQVEFKGAITPDTCYNDILTPLTEEQAKQYERLQGCKGASMYKNYYSYLVGLPMKLMDPEAIIHEEILERTYHNKIYDVVKVNYNEPDDRYTWYFYFDKNTHAMDLCKFTSKEDERSGGEYIIYNDVKDYQNMKLAFEWVWLYNTPTLDTLAVEQIHFK